MDNKILKGACPECGSDMVLRYTLKFGGRYFYGCSEYPICNAIHGCHQDSKKPFGIPADKETKQWRIKAHKSFDWLWKSGNMKRAEAYKWMQLSLGLSSKKAHIGMFDLNQCRQLIECVDEYEKSHKEHNPKYEYIGRCRVCGAYGSLNNETLKCVECDEMAVNDIFMNMDWGSK